MENTGTFGDVTWIVWAAALPYILWFLGDIICKIYAISPSKTRYVTQYVEKPVIKTVYRRKIVTRPQSLVAQSEEKVAVNHVVTGYSVGKAETVDTSMINEAVAGLVNLGVKKSEAKKMVKTLCLKKKYTSVEDLLGDCFSKL